MYYCYCAAAQPPQERRYQHVEVDYRKRGGVSDRVTVRFGDILIIKARNPGPSHQGPGTSHAYPPAQRYPTGKDLIPANIHWRLLQIVDSGDFPAGAFGFQRAYQTPTVRIADPDVKVIQPGYYKLSIWCDLAGECDLTATLQAREATRVTPEPAPTPAQQQSFYSASALIPDFYRMKM